MRARRDAERMDVFRRFHQLGESRQGVARLGVPWRREVDEDGEVALNDQGIVVHGIISGCSPIRVPVQELRGIDAVNMRRSPRACEAPAAPRRTGTGRALSAIMNRKSIAALSAATMIAAACSPSQDQEVAIGRQNAEQVNARLPILRDPEAADYVQQLGISMAAKTSRSDLDWKFFIVDSKDVNAFALPGGFIYVNRGLIDHAQELDELAGALGHEIGHVVLRHSVQQMAQGICNSDLARAAIQIGGAAYFARYSRLDEAQADSVAVENVMRAGIDPHGIPSLFERLLEERKTSPLRIEAFFASHPMEEDRIRATAAEINAIDPAELRGLRRDDPGFQAFKTRLKTLPRAPEPDPSQQLPTDSLRSSP
jgi:predicted Zn-dependent protease